MQVNADYLRENLRLMAATQITEKSWRLSRNSIIFLCLYAGLNLALFAYSAWQGIYSRDELKYYITPITKIVENLPTLTISGYEMAVPPLFVNLQAGVFRYCGGSWQVVRLISVVASLGIAYLFVREADRADVRIRTFCWLVCLVALLQPSFLGDFFQLKAHPWSIVFLLAGYLLWASETSDIRRLIVSAILLSVATLSSQLAVPFVAYLWILEVMKNRNVTRAAILGVPIGVLFIVFITWKGVQPPAYRSFVLESQTGSLRLHWEQLLVGLSMIGVWLFPLVAVGRRVAWVTIPAMGLAAAAVYASGIWRSDVPFWEMQAGPVASSLRMAFGRWPALLILVWSIPVALGVVTIVAGFRDRRTCPIAIVCCLYLGMMNFVPYRFEGYYVTMIVPAMFLSLRSFEAPVTNLRRAQIVLCLLFCCLIAAYCAYELLVRGTLI